MLGLCGTQSHLASQGINLLGHAAHGTVTRQSVAYHGLEAQVDEGLVDGLLLQLLRDIAADVLHGIAHTDKLARIGTDGMAVVAVYQLALQIGYLEAVVTLVDG